MVWTKYSKEFVMIIWGSVGRESVVATGEFFCPHCSDTRQYKRVRVSRWFTLYFIPLFPTSTLGEFIRCTECKQDYRLDVLEFSPTSSPESEPITQGFSVQGGYRDHFQDSITARSLPDSGGNRELETLQAELAGGLPLQMATQKLINSGMEEETARNLVQAARGPSQKFCFPCDLSYIDSVKRCSRCGKSL
jgi:hypothetical protein